FKGDVYPYRKLRSGIDSRKIAFSRLSDIEMLVEKYLRDGLPVLERLTGLLASAIGDRVPDDRFFACDAQYLKPLSYGESVDGFLVQSGIQSVLGPTAHGAWARHAGSIAVTHLISTES